MHVITLPENDCEACDATTTVHTLRTLQLFMRNELMRFDHLIFRAVNCPISSTKDAEHALLLSYQQAQDSLLIGLSSVEEVLSWLDIFFDDEASPSAVSNHVGH